jgi:hypothetical protein
MKRLPLLALAVLLGCGSDNNVVPPETLVAGTWRFTYTNLAGVLEGLPVSCTPVSLNFSIGQGLTTFSGVQVGTATLTCATDAGALTSRVIASETITQGQIDGRSVLFRFGTIPGTQSGVVGQASINGTSQWVLVVNNLTLTLNGQFSASRL